MKRYIVRISGRVQGVGFRYFTISKAQLLGIEGFVKNLTDGSVLVDCEGENENIELFLNYLNQGPPFSSVIEVVAEEKEPVGYSDFFIKK